MSHAEEEIIQILQFMDKSSFDELQLSTNDLLLIVRKNGCVAGIDHNQASLPSPGRISGEGLSNDPLLSDPESEKVEHSESSDKEQDGLLPITAPILGICYLQPEPGAPPYVEVGTAVEEGTTICLIETMKVFNAVRSGVRGSIQRVCVNNGELVEYGQTLFLVSQEDING